MKKIFVFLIYVVVFISTFPRAVELKERAIVQAVGIDMHDGKYDLTALYYSPSSSGGESSAQTDASAEKSVFASAETIDDAFSLISSKTGKINYYGHNNIIVIGMTALKNGADNIFSYINSNPDMLADIDLLVSETTAYDILTANTDESMLPSQALAKITQTSKDSGKAPQDGCIEIMNAYLGGNTDVIMPTVRTLGDGDDRSYDVSGAVAVRNGKYLTQLDSTETTGYNLLRGGKCSFFVNTQINDLDCSVKIYSSGISEKNGVFTVECGAAVDNVTPTVAKLSSQQTQKVKSASEKAIKELCGAYLKKASNNALKVQEMSAESTENIIVKIMLKIYKSVEINA